MARDHTGNTAQESIIRFNPNATGSFSMQFDSYFLTGFAPKFYSVREHKSLSLNTLPELHEALTIPFGFEKNASTSFAIELAENGPNTPLYLYDTKLKLEHQLGFNSPYEFTLEASDDPMRFQLRFRSINETTSVTEPMAEANASMFVSDNTLYVNFAQATANSVLEVYDISGRRLMMHQRLGDGLQHSLPLGLQTGIYLVRIVGTHHMQTEKIYVY